MIKKLEQMMNDRFVTLASFTVVLLLVASVGSQNLSAYAASTNPPSLGGGRYQFTDGLKINGHVFDISKFSQKISTQNLSIGKPSVITLKIFDNHGPTTIKTALVYLNIRGPGSSVSTSDTWIVCDMTSGVSIHDPHHLLGKVNANLSVNGKFAYATFDITPKSKMDTSDMVLGAWDEDKSSIYSTVFSAITFS